MNKTRMSYLFFPIAATLFFTLVFTNMYASLFLHADDGLSQNQKVFVFAIVYAVCHPIIGKLIHVIVGLLCKAIDHIYAPENSWFKGNQQYGMVLASIWPFYGAIMLPITIIGVVYGLLFRSLF